MEWCYWYELYKLAPDTLYKDEYRKKMDVASIYQSYSI